MSGIHQMRPDEALESYVDEMLGPVPSEPVEPSEPAGTAHGPRASRRWCFFESGFLHIAVPAQALRAIKANGFREVFGTRGTDGSWYCECELQQRQRTLVDIERFLIFEEGLVLPESTGNEVHTLEIVDTEFALLLRGREVELEISEADVIWSSTERRRRWLSGVSVEKKVVIIDLEGLLDIAVERKRR